MIRTRLVAFCLTAVVAANAVAQEKKAAPEFRPPENVVMENDIEYGRAGDRSLKLDLARPKEQGNKVLPVVVFIHGGGWQAGNKEGGRQAIAGFAATGNYIGVTVGYRLSQEAIWPAQIHDCKAAIRWIRANAEKYHINPDKIGAVGNSAGGHLVALLGTSGDIKELEGNNGNAGFSSRVNCVVDFCGPSDFLHFNEQKGNGGQSAVRNLFGGNPTEKADAARAASPVTWASKDDPPFLIIHGSEDATVPYAQGEAMNAALKQASVNATFITVDGAGHGGLNVPEVMQRQRNFFDKHLRGGTADIPGGSVKAAPAPENKKD